MLALTTPWRPLSGPVPGGTVAPDASRDFTAAQIARAAAFDGAISLPAYLSLALSLLSVLVLGLTPLGARLLGVVIRPARRWPLQLIVAAIVLTAVLRIVTLPFRVWAETISRRHGLSTQDWGGWAQDQLKGFMVGVIMWIVVLVLLHVLVRRFPRYWWTGAAAGGAALVVAASFLYPLVFEPLFNSFRPMPAGPVRTEVLRLAAADHVPIRDVLVADASRRTTALNAYVSGFGSTRRVVVYDTLLKSGRPDEIKLIVAHELGHAKRGDVLYGTLMGALGVAAGVCVLYLLMTSRRLLTRAGVASPTPGTGPPAAADPRSFALLLAMVTVLLQLGGPAQNLVSRHIEARADRHALDLTGDPATFTRMQRALSVRNLSDLRPNPLEYVLWSSHPSGPERIAMARNWARLHGRPDPPPLAGR
ncbi:M48 family metallopeptidase [Actinomadura alba]|uniref:M48 family metallopeptidase n=2 Tax=Actinomadura alba TaxID=406431 RepID=A0ABR7LKH9_9ACTN|nr:M48 family metallopeptidase [Actinomadura alba]